MSSLPLPVPLRTRSARLARGLAWLTGGLAALLVLERFSAPALALLVAGTGTWQALGLAVFRAVPEVCYLLALWWVHQAMAEFGQGVFHTPGIARALQRVGMVLTAGAAFRVFLLPSLERLLGSPPGFVVAVDVGSMVLCALGLSLAMLANVLERAGAVQAELDEIF